MSEVMLWKQGVSGAAQWVLKRNIMIRVPGEPRPLPYIDGLSWGEIAELFQGTRVRLRCSHSDLGGLHEFLQGAGLNIVRSRERRPGLSWEEQRRNEFYKRLRHWELQSPVGTFSDREAALKKIQEAIDKDRDLIDTRHEDTVLRLAM